MTYQTSVSRIHQELALEDFQHAASINLGFEHLYFLNGATPSVGGHKFPLAQ
jgi:hypothetical protein